MDYTTSAAAQAPSERPVQYSLPETRFIELMIELFQLQEAEALDFGLYRVIRRHNREVHAFLGEIVTDKEAKALRAGRLSQRLDKAFAALGDEAQAEDKFRITDLEQQLGLKPGMTLGQREAVLTQAESIPAAKGLVSEYRSRAESLASRQTVSQDRAEVLNRLYQFFSRHYQDGDFIVLRRYGKGGARYVKSTGEDTEFHWATEDMYYIKSGDIFTDFPLRLASGQRLLFTVEPESLQATRAALKPNDKAHYELDQAVKEDEVVKLRLKYLKGAQTEKQKDEIVAAALKTGIGAAVEADIRRWLNRFIARNQSDFFIHKRLKEALSDDLDIFIKAEVLDTDQLLADGDLPQRALKVARIVRQVGGEIIAFLAALEDFQKALWEKKKLVFETRYVITLDRLERHCPAWLAQNIALIVARQAGEWRDLGLGDYPDTAACVRKTPGDLATAASECYLPLPLDTRNFDADFKWSLLAAVTAATPLDEALDGVAIQSDNWQALNTLETKYQERVKCIYIDPPYNTNSSGIPYKNGYRHASFAALMQNRIHELHRMLANDGAIFVSIDKTERTILEHTLDSVFGADNRVEELIWAMNTNNSQAPNYSTNHEYVHVYARHRPTVEQDKAMFREPKPGFEEVMSLVAELNPSYPKITEIEAAIRALYEQHKLDYRSDVEAQGLDLEEEKDNNPWRGLYNYSHAEYRNADGRLVPEREAKAKRSQIWVWQEADASMPATKQAESTRDPNHPNWRFYTPPHPITGLPCPHPKSGWKFAYADDEDSPDKRSFKALDRDHRIAFGENEKKVPRIKRMLHEVETNVGKSVFRDYSDGEKQTSAMFGKSGVFLAPKHTDFVSRFILQGSKAESTVLDCFGGSGSTAHAVINVNRLERTRRKFVTVEVNRYFETIIIPRLKKAGAAVVWISGHAKKVDGAGLFTRVQCLEQYDDTLESLDAELLEDDVGDLFEDQAFALRYRLDRASRALYCGVERFASPFGYQLKRAAGAGEAAPCEVDLVESLPYLLGLDVDRLYREPQGVVLLGRNRRGQSVAVFFRETALTPGPSPASGRGEKTSAEWVAEKLALHPADRVYSNDPAGLSFEGCERLEAIESVFTLQFERN
jgi:adenine-specific DNA-methyltransferase